ncbi:hypothetical protein RRF57_006547 [Xylaria bambusicola]|uniref:Chromo domain-containing protein n=1 Tax=Xylaria bambusicola TaxID=326684 RepID=A0AAN7Z6V7_9PEZI
MRGSITLALLVREEKAATGASEPCAQRSEWPSGSANPQPQGLPLSTTCSIWAPRVWSHRHRRTATVSKHHPILVTHAITLLNSLPFSACNCTSELYHPPIILLFVSFVREGKTDHGLHVETDRPGPVTRSMNTADREKAQREAHDNRRLLRDRRGLRPSSSPSPSPSPIARSKPKTKQGQKSSPKLGKGWFAIRDITDEKVEKGRIFYLIDWEGTDLNGRPYEPNWEPAENVTADAINDWRNKKHEASKVTGAPDGDNENDNSLPAASTNETDPAQAPKRRKIVLESSENESPADSLGRTGEGSRRTAQANRLPTPSENHPPSACSDSGIAEARLVTPSQGAQIVVALPRAPTFDASEYQAISFSQASQTSSQITLPERMHSSSIALRDQRIIPDSQEISGTSASEAHNSHHRFVDSFGESQLSQGPPALPELPENPHAPPSSDIPSHQLESRSRFAGVSGFFVNPNISTNPGFNPSSQFQTQVEFDFNNLGPTPSTSHTTTVPESVLQNHTAQPSQIPPGTESQYTQSTSGGSTTNNSQAAQIVQPLSSHPGGATSPSQSVFSVFEDRTVPGTTAGNSEVHADPQDSSQALSEIAGNIRISTASEGHNELASSAVSLESQAAIQAGEKAGVRHISVGPSPKTRPAPSTSMEGTSAAEALRLFREEHFNKRARTGSASPAVASPALQSPAPLENATHVAVNPAPMPEAEAHVDNDKTSAIDVSPPVISPALLHPSGITQNQTVPSFPLAQAVINPNPPLEHMPVDPISSYDMPQIQQPTTLDPSTLTLSIENDVEGSPSVPTDDGFAPGTLPESTISDEDEMQEDYPRSILPHVPTGPSEYLITLPFQTSCRPQYNDIIRENEKLINEYNSAFSVLPHQTPRRDVVEKLDHMFSRLFDICDHPPFLDTLGPMTSEQIMKHVIGTNSKFSFVAELLDNLRDLNSDKKVLILVRPGKLMDLLGHVIQGRGYHYFRSGQEIVSASDARHPLTIFLCSTSKGESSIPGNVDAVIAFDHTFRQQLVPSLDQSAPVILALVNIASIQHINMRIMEDLEPLERKNFLMLALVKAMRYIEEPDSTESLFDIAEKFARRIQMPEDEEDEFYYEPQSVPVEIFHDLYAASSQMEGTQLSGQSLDIDQHPGSRKRSYLDGDNEESLPKRPKMFQPQVVTSLNNISDSVRNLLGDDLAQSSEGNTIAVSLEKLEALADKANSSANILQFTELMSKLRESKAREDDFRQLSDRNQNEADSYRSSINNIQTRYMDALKERGIFEADCRAAQEQAAIQSRSLESCRTEIATLKTTKAELEKKLAEANDALLHSSNPDLVKMAKLETSWNTANAQVEDLKKRLVVVQSDADYNKNLYQQASHRAAELAAENRGYERKNEELRRKADSNVIAVNKTQSRNEGKTLSMQVAEYRTIIRERETELNRVREELKSLRSSRRETRQSSVPRSPRMSALGVMSPRNGGTRGPSAIAMGGPSSSRASSPQPPVAVFDGPPGSGNGVQNAAMHNQSPGVTRLTHLRDSRF